MDGRIDRDDKETPIRLYVGLDLNSNDELELSRDQAQEYIEDIQELLDQLEAAENNYVQVKFDNANFGRLYTYRDPSGELKVGDRVLVPTAYRPETTGFVVELGKGSFVGNVKDVAAKLERVEL